MPDDDKSDNENRAEINLVVRTAWEFYPAIKQLSAEALANVTNYKSGQEADYLYNQFMNIYMIREEIVPGDPTRRTIIRKPTIYDVVHFIGRRLNRELKSNRMGQEQATAELTDVLKVAISALGSETGSFGDVLQQNHKSAAAPLSVFQNIRLTDI